MTHTILPKIVPLIVVVTLSLIPVSTFSYSINIDVKQVDIQLLIQTFDQDEAVLNRKYNIRYSHEYANAEAEVRRSFEGNYGPLYQIAYMIGGMQIYALYTDLVENGEMSAKEFHDTILKEGSIPIRVVRSILINENLTKEGPEAWNFAEYIYN